MAEIRFAWRVKKLVELVKFPRKRLGSISSNDGGEYSILLLLQDMLIGISHSNLWNILTNTLGWIKAQRTKKIAPQVLIIPGCNITGRNGKVEMGR